MIDFRGGVIVQTGRVSIMNPLVVNHRNINVEYTSPIFRVRRKNLKCPRN